MVSRSLTRQVALIYRIYFLYLDPIFALGGVYLILADPVKFISSTVPAPLVLSPPPIIPIVQVLLTNIAALYAYLAINESLVLRLTDDMAVWKAVIAALVITDVGHVYGVYAAAPDRMFEVLQWTHEELINMGILTFGLGLRIAFLLGIGNGR